MVLTKKQLSKWVTSSGVILQDGWVSNAYSYESGTENEPVEDGIMLRKWGDTEWHEATTDYTGNIDEA